MKPYPPIVETERLMLRPFEIKDGSRVREIINCREIYDVTSLIPHPYEEGMAEEWISTHLADYYANKGVFFAVTEKNTNDVVGAVGIRGDSANKCGELGYWMGVAYWGKGYCSEAAKAVVGFCFDVLGYHRVGAHHFECNPASGRVMQKIGMQYEGKMIDHVLKDGIYHNAIFYGIVSPDH